MRKLLSVRTLAIEIDAVLLFARLIIGTAFIIIGWAKIQTPFSWMPPAMGFSKFWQGLAALAEFGGGVIFVLGLLTRLGAFGIACTMTVAIYMHMMVFNDPFVNLKGGSSYQVAAAYLVISLMLLIIGPGRFSIDSLLFGTSQKIKN